jgi:competence protein ComEC
MLPLLWVSLSFLLGVTLASAVRLSPSVWVGLAAISLLWQVLRWRFKASAAHGLLQQRYFPFILLRQVPAWVANIQSGLAAWRSPVPLAVLLVGLFLGAARYQAAQPELTPGEVAWRNDSEEIWVVEGTVIEPPVVLDQVARLRVAAYRLRPSETLLFSPVHGKLLANVAASGGWRYGDRVRLEGYLVTPFETEDFSYQDVLARQEIYSTMNVIEINRIGSGAGDPIRAAIYSLRERSKHLIYRLWPDPEASLLAGILLGDEAGISEAVLQAFKDTGTSHVIAISGFNITILAGLFSTLFGRVLGRKRRFLAAALSGIMIALYTVLVGAQAAVVRAALMGGLALFARQLGSRQDGLNSLGLVAALMALANPNVLWEAGFQLSFMATLGLVLYAEPFSRAFVRAASRRLPEETALRLAGPVGEYILFTLAAQLMTLPVMAYSFQRLSLSALLANPLILPAQPAVMILGGLALLAGLILQPVGQLLAYAAWPFVAYTIRVVDLLAGWRGGVLALGQVTLPGVVLFYLGVLLWTAMREKITGVSMERLKAILRPGVLLAALGVLTVFIWRVGLSAPDGRLHLTVLSVGSGEALLVQTPGGRYLLINGGGSTRALSEALGRRMPLLHRQLDFLIVAGVNEDQIGGLAGILERYPPAQVLWSGPPAGTGTARDLLKKLGQAGVPYQLAQAGQALDLGEGAGLRVLGVSRRGAVLLLEWGDFRALLPVGMDFEQMEAMLSDPGLGRVNALLLAEGGVASLNPPEWIAGLSPQYVLMSVGAGGERSLLDPELEATLASYTLLRTDYNGWIHLSTDGEQMWVEVERR